MVALRRSVVDWRRAVVHVRAALDVDDRLKGRRLAAVLAHRVVEISPGQPHMSHRLAPRFRPAEPLVVRVGLYAMRVAVIAWS